MSNAEIIERMVALDKSDVDLPTWEAGFCESMVRKANCGDFFLSEKQRECALKILDQYEGENRGEQEVVVKLPPGKERYFKRS